MFRDNSWLSTQYRVKIESDASDGNRKHAWREKAKVVYKYTSRNRKENEYSLHLHVQSFSTFNAKASQLVCHDSLSQPYHKSKLKLQFHGNRCPTVAIKWKNERCECSNNTTGKMTRKNFRLWAVFEPTTFTLPVQRSTNCAIKATWEQSCGSHLALIAQLVEHYTGNAKVVGSNPVQSLKIFFRAFLQWC